MLNDTCPSVDHLRLSLDPDSSMTEQERQQIEEHIDSCQQGCKEAISALLRDNTLVVAPGTPPTQRTPNFGGEVLDFLAPVQLPDEMGRLGHYRILKKLGSGGMGMVFLAEDTLLHRKVALKTMLPSIAASPLSRERFLREARAAASVEHENIVAIHQVGEDNHVPFIAMPLLKGESLEVRLQRDRRLPLSEALQIAIEMAEGLAAAHAAGLIHRDIKPANIWLETDTRVRVKILDFGLVRSAGDRTGLTLQGTIIGTPSFMAPEQATGMNVDHRSDLFSLGCVVYRMCTGELPFKGADTLSFLASLAMDNPKPPQTIDAVLPMGLSDLIMRLLAKRPDDRPANARMVIDALRTLESDQSKTQVDLSADKTLTLSTPPPRQNTGRRSRMGIVLALVGLACFLGGAGAIYYWKTNNGIVRVEINDPDIQVAFDNNGPVVKGVDKKEIKIPPGEYRLHVTRGDLGFDTDKIVVEKGETLTIKVDRLEDGKVQVVLGDKVIGQKSEVAVARTIAPPPPQAALPNKIMYVAINNMFDRDVRVIFPSPTGDGNDVNQVYAPGFRWITIGRPTPQPIRVKVEGGQGADIFLKPHYDSEHGWWWYGVGILADGSVVTE